MKYLCLVLLLANVPVFSSVADARAMISRNQHNHGTGYDTGRGRFVDRDRLLAIEFDALTPAKASTQTDEKNRVQEWGAEVQYNLAGFAIGPEFWFGEYHKKNPGENGADTSTGEYYRVLYNRYQVTLSRFRWQEHMRGWYFKLGYSFTKIDAETNFLATEDATQYTTIDESRHGPVAGVGHRFTFWRNRTSLNIGLSYTSTESRDISDLDSETRRRFESVLANAGDKRLATKDFPEARIALGVLF